MDIFTITGPEGLFVQITQNTLLNGCEIKNIIEINIKYQDMNYQKLDIVEETHVWLINLCDIIGKVQSQDYNDQIIFDSQNDKIVRIEIIKN